MSNKLRLKEMSHKKLRKLCKGLTRELRAAQGVAESRAKECVDLHKTLRKTATELEDELNRYKMQKEKDDKRIKDLEYAIDTLGYTADKDGVLHGYIGEMPEDLQMGVDGQLRDEGNCISHQTKLPKSADVDAAVEWAKRNGHHQPEGNPEPNKMDNVRIKSADEISVENVERHTEIVYNDIANDKSRLLESDSDFDKEGDYEEWSRE